MPDSILVCFALEAEARPFRVLVRAQTGMEILVTGMGRVKARLAVEKALANARPRFVLTCGFAGALNPKLAAGSVLFAADEAFPMTADLRAAGAQEARFYCASQVIATASAKRALFQEKGADAVEMESQAIRSLCRERGIPSATIRVISDVATEDLPMDFNRFLTADLRMKYGKLVIALLANPSAIKALMQFQHRCRNAAQDLARALATVLGALRNDSTPLRRQKQLP